MTVKIAVISSSEHLIKLACNLKDELDLKVVAENHSYKEAKQAAHKLTDEGAEIILARGQTAKEIRDCTDLPVIECGLTMLDLIQTMRNLEYINKSIAISNHMFVSTRFNDIVSETEKILNVSFKVFNYIDRASLRDVLSEISMEDIETVLGGSNVARTASSMGLNGVEILTSTHTLLDILRYARQIALLRRKEENESKWLRASLDLVNEGIVAVNTRGEITNLNNKATIMLSSAGINNSDSIEAYFPELNQSVIEKKSYKDRIIETGGEKYVTSFHPIQIRNEYAGGLISIDMVSNIQNLEHNIRKQLSDKGLVAKTKLQNIVGTSPLMKNAIGIAADYAKTSFSILISGESGTGKELFAQGIHLESSRDNGPFVAINCAALPDNLLESELFGYEEGAFTGARKGGKTGFFELAHRGTIFLDEINSISLSLQARLLRVVQEKQILRVGGDKIIPIDVRIIAATNVDLLEKVHMGQFREDLYYRINELNLTIPPLHKRKDDIPKLVRHFLLNYITTQASEKEFGDLYTYIADTIWEKLPDYSWPGNVRELENIVKRCIVLFNSIKSSRSSMQRVIEDSCIMSDKISEPDNNNISVQLGSLEEMEEELIRKASEKLGYNKKELSRTLQVSRTTLWRRLNKTKCTRDGS